MKCPQCCSSNLRKDGRQNGKQRFECKDCDRLFRDSCEASGYHSDEQDHPIVAELDQLQIYVGRKADKIWLWTAIDRHAPGILAIEIGDRSGRTFAKLWQRIRTWESRRYLTDGYYVYANYINPEKHLVLPKIFLTRVEGENTRLRHYIARLHRATLCYSV